jgi:uncharacterized membrane protein
MAIDEFYELIKTVTIVLGFLTVILIFVYLSLEKRGLEEKK